MVQVTISVSSPELLTFLWNSRWRPPPSWIFSLCKFGHSSVLIVWYLCSVPNLVQVSVIVTEIDAHMPQLKVKVKVWTLAIAPLTWLVTSSALQSRKWQLIGVSQWCRSALCGHPLPALTDNWTNGAASRHTIAPISHTKPSSRSRSYYSFLVPLRIGGWVGLSTQ